MAVLSTSHANLGEPHALLKRLKGRKRKVNMDGTQFNFFINYSESGSRIDYTIRAVAIFPTVMIREMLNQIAVTTNLNRCGDKMMSCFLLTSCPFMREFQKQNCERSLGTPLE